VSRHLRPWTYVEQGLCVVLIILSAVSREWYVIAVALLGIYAGWYGRRMLERYSN
jgi:hypothetical protein